MGIGIRIKELMERKGVSAYTVSSDTGISQSTLSRLLSELPTHAKAMGWASGFNGCAT